MFYLKLYGPIVYLDMVLQKAVTPFELGDEQC
jgi:hypothetical protein